MKTSQNTVLITGGGSGIGFETAKLFSHKGNRVILSGRNEDKLKQAVAQLDHDAHYIVADVTREEDVKSLIDRVTSDFPDLNVLMNNAGTASLYNIGRSDDVIAIARNEMETNYFAAVNLTTRLLPLLRRASEAAIINVTSIVAFAPGLSLPTYSASKAALHSYTQVLRLSLAGEQNIKIFEVMPPLVDTEFAKDIKSDKKIGAWEVAKDILLGMSLDNTEIRVASAETLYRNFLGRPDQAARALNGLPLQ